MHPPPRFPTHQLDSEATLTAAQSTISGAACEHEAISLANQPTSANTSSAVFPGLPAIAAEFDASDIEVTLTTSLFMLFGGFGPILWASMSDFYHVRRFLYLVSLLIFTGASVGCALSINVYMLLVMRLVQSVGTSVTISVGAGTVSDCWEVIERGTAFSTLFVGQFVGPLVGPILGGGLTTALGWRSTFWFCAGYGIFLFAFLFFFLPETYRMEGMWEPLSEKPGNSAAASSLLQYADSSDEEDDARTIADGGDDVDVENGNDDDMYEASIAPPPDPKTSLNPIKSVYLLRHLFVLLIALETGSVFGTMFTIETIIPDLFESTYGFVSWQTGLSYLGAGIGNVIGSYVAGALSDELLKRARQKRGGIPKAEDRLTLNAWPGGLFLVPLGVLVFGWGLNAHWTVWVAIVAFGIVCFGMSQVYAAGQAYLVDSVPGQGASVAAASNVMRTGMACILSLVAQPVVNAIGPGYLSVALAGLNLFGMLLFFIVKVKGQDLRIRAGYGDNQA
ncbi:major facilitator superfamily domain-containing protein [Dichotomocladium elegans]|nr:major facilitator superfamily domain-containing protein [Dichotomocladium elegans]